MPRKRSLQNGRYRHEPFCYHLARHRANDIIFTTRQKLVETQGDSSARQHIDMMTEQTASSMSSGRSLSARHLRSR